MANFNVCLAMMQFTGGTIPLPELHVANSCCPVHILCTIQMNHDVDQCSIGTTDNRLYWVSGLTLIQNSHDIGKKSMASSTEIPVRRKSQQPLSEGSPCCSAPRIEEFVT